MKGKVNTSGYLWCLFAILLCVNAPFIICDFIFAYRGNCVDDPVSGIPFTLSLWLQVEGATRAAIVALFFIVALLSCCSLAWALKLLMCAFCTLIVYSLFAFAWLIIGAVMFWGHLNNEGNCSGQVRGYMWALLIIGFLGVLGNCCNSYQQRSANNIE